MRRATTCAEVRRMSDPERAWYTPTMRTASLRVPATLTVSSCSIVGAGETAPMRLTPSAFDAWPETRLAACVRYRGLVWRKVNSRWSLAGKSTSRHDGRRGSKWWCCFNGSGPGSTSANFDTRPLHEGGSHVGECLPSLGACASGLRTHQHADWVCCLCQLSAPVVVDWSLAQANLSRHQACIWATIAVTVPLTYATPRRVTWCPMRSHAERRPFPASLLRQGGFGRLKAKTLARCTGRCCCKSSLSVDRRSFVFLLTFIA